MSGRAQQRERKQEANGPVLTRPSSGAHDSLHAAPHPQARLRQLQWSIGNQRVSRMLQKKLVVGPAGDEYEREADRVAEAVTAESAQPSSARSFLRGPRQAAPLQRECSCGGTCSSCQEEEEEKVQRKEAPSAASSQAVSDAPPIVDEVLRSPGQPLDPATRAYFEPRFGYDFSGVRIHNSDRAAASADRVGALAYTVGRHIAFAEGRYTPACQSGQKLLAHELAHVVQQSRGIAASDHAPEVQAEAHEQKATQLSTGVATAPRMRLQRKPDAITSIVINLTTSSISITFDDGTTLSGSVKTNLEPRDYTARWDEKSQEFEVAPYPTKERVLQFQVSGTPAFRARYLSARKQVKTPIPLRVSGGPDTKTPPDNSSAPGSLLGGKILASVPVIFIANDVTRPGLGLPAGGTGQGSLGLQGSPFTSIGLGANVLASGDLSWLSNADAARRVLSPDYWEPFLGPARRSVTLDRLVNEIPRDLAPKIEAELAARAAGSPRPLSWVRRGFSEPELISIPDLVRRLDEGGIGRLSPAELEFLRNAASVHVGGSTPGSPFASYSRAGFNVRSIGNRQYRVRVEVARPGILDLSAPNEFNQFGQLPDITNVEEADLLVVANQQGRLVSVQRLQGVEEASFLLKYGSEIRWGGRIVFVAGLALSAYRVAEAPPDQRAIVASEETGGQIGGFLGTAAAVAGCVALGIATGGVGLFLCGLAGGIIGGVGGSAIGGGIARSFEPYGGPSRPMTQAESEEAARTIDRANLRQPCPSCHELRREWDERLRFRSPSGLSGGNLTPEDLARLRPLFDPAGSSR